MPHADAGDQPTFLEGITLMKHVNTTPQPYVRGKTLTVVKPVDVGNVDRIINLAQNESCYGPAPGVVEAASERARTAHLYADPGNREMREAIAARFGLDAARVVCGNGSEELLDGAGRVFARAGDEILFPEYSFLQFPIVAYRLGATAVSAPNKPDFTIDVEALLERVTERTRVVFVANPNNPTGVYNRRGDIEDLIARLPPHILLVLDSAYAEYCDAPDYCDGLEYVDRHPNIVVTRTFSKAYGMAALRAGWAYGTAEITAALNNMRGIGNVNGCAQAAAIAALDSPDFVTDVCARSAAERTRLTNALTSLGIEVLPSATNFVFLHLPAHEGRSAADALRHLARNGVITRTNEDYGLDDYLRISLGNSEENDIVADLMAEFMA